MKNLLLAAALLAISSSVHAQSARPVRQVPPPAAARPATPKIVLVPNFGTVSDVGFIGDQSGFGVDAKVALPSGLSMLGGAKVYSDSEAYSIGIGYGTPVGAAGTLSVSATIGLLDVTNLVEFGTQTTLRAGYEHAIGSGIRVGAGIAHFFNGGDIGNDVTALTLSVGYELSKALSLDLTYSPDDAILGVDSAKNSLQLSLGVSF